MLDLNSFFIGFVIALLIDKTYIQYKYKSFVHPTVYIFTIMTIAIVTMYFQKCISFLFSCIWKTVEKEDDKKNNKTILPRRMEFNTKIFNDSSYTS